MSESILSNSKNCSLPLGNKKREIFCQLYAAAFWGKPAEAVRAANYKMTGTKASRFAEELLADETIRARIRHLRDLRSELSIADSAWVKECLIEIITSGKKDADRIRALANLNKLLLSSGKGLRDKRAGTIHTMELPAFEGIPEGKKEDTPHGNEVEDPV